MNNKKQLTKVSVLIDKLNYLNDNLNLNKLKSSDVDFKLLKNYSLELFQLLNEVEQTETSAPGSHAVREQLFDHTPSVPSQPTKQAKDNIFTEPPEKKTIKVAAQASEIVESETNLALNKNATENIFDTVKAIKKQTHQHEEVVEKKDFQPIINEAKVLNIEEPEEKEEKVVFEIPKPIPPKPEITEVQSLSELEEEDEAESLSLNDRFKTTSESVANKVSTASTRNFKELIDINDRFLFIQSLFGGSYLAFEEAIKQINKIENYSEALDYVDYKLKGTYGWSADSTEVTKFLNILERSYG